MTRTQLENLLTEHYGVEGEFPWAEYPSYSVFRHKGSRKWFAVIMSIPRHKLEPGAEGRVDVVNLKCPPKESLALQQHPGIFPAYHMHKGLWISVTLDGRVEDELLCSLVETSFSLTGTKKIK